MRTFIDLLRLRSAIRHGRAEGVESILPGFLNKNPDNAQYLNELLFETARVALLKPADTSIRIFNLLIGAGADVNAVKEYDSGKKATPLSLVVALHSDRADLPDDLSPDLKWVYAVDRQNWNNGSLSPQVGYHPEVVRTLLRAGADLKLAPVVVEWSYGFTWHLPKDNLDELFKEVARVNRNEPIEAFEPQTPSASSGRGHRTSP